MNAFKHGGYSQEAKREFQVLSQCRQVLREYDKFKASLACSENSENLD